MLLDSLRPTLFLTMVQPLKYHETGHLEILQGLGENKTKQNKKPKWITEKI